MKRRLITLSTAFVFTFASMPALAHTAGQAETASQTPTVLSSEAAAPTGTATWLPTPTATATPTATPGPSPTPALVPCNGSEQEPNDGGWGCVLATGAMLTAQLDPGGDADWFLAWLASDRQYRLEATAITAGLDPRLTVQRLNGEAIAASTRPPASQIVGITLQVDAPAYFAVAVTTNGVVTGTYTLRVAELAPTPIPSITPTLYPSASPWPSGTASPRPSTTPRPGEQFEPNDDWSQAAELQLGRAQSKTLIGGEWWALRVKPDVTYPCNAASSDFDPTLRVTQGGGPVITWNDDSVPGNTQAVATWANIFDGLAYLQVESTFGSGLYQITCSGSTPAPTLPPPPTLPTLPPPPTFAPFVPTVALPSPTPAAHWRLIGAAQQATPAVTTLTVQAYYDLNDNQAPDPGEGIAGLSVRALAGGAFVAWGLTDGDGRVSLSVVGAVDRVGVPFLNLYERVKPGETRTITWRVAAVRLPVFLPVAADEAAR